MCVYCNCGDQFFKWDPPFPVDPWKYPTVPQPVRPGPFTPWSVERLREYLELLQQIKEMEDKLGCPCIPNKADYIGLLKERIKKLEEGGA